MASNPVLNAFAEAYPNNDDDNLVKTFPKLFTYVKNVEPGKSATLVCVSITQNNDVDVLETCLICLRTDHTECDQDQCTNLTGMVEETRIRYGALDIYWGLPYKGLFRYEKSGDRERKLTCLCTRTNHGAACHPYCGCRFKEDPVVLIDHSDEKKGYVRVVYATGCEEYIGYTTRENIVNYPPRLTRGVSDGNPYGTSCKVCGFGIQGPSKEYDTKCHKGRCMQVHNYVEFHRI